MPTGRIPAGCQKAHAPSSRASARPKQQPTTTTTLTDENLGMMITSPLPAAVGTQTFTFSCCRHFATPPHKSFYNKALRAGPEL